MNRSPVPPMHFADWFQRHAVTRPNRAAIATPRARLTYAEFYRALLVSARRLEEAGLERGQVVAVCVQSHALHCLLLMALNRLGVVSISLSPPKQADQSVDVPEAVLADRFLIEEPFAGVIPSNSLTIGLDWLKPPESEATNIKSPGFRDRHELAHILTTSGTTGMVKAVGLSIRQWESRVFRANVGLLAEGHSGPVLAQFGLASATGFRFALETFWAGGTFFLGWPAPSIAEVISRNKVVRTYGSPATYQSMLEHSDPEILDLSSLRYALVTGSATPAPLATQIRGKICRTFVNMYGLTEMGTISFGVSTPQDARGNCGVLLPWIQAQVVDGDDEVLPAGVEGILRLRSDAMATGYLNDPKASAEKFRNGWFYPGDLGIVSEQRNVMLTGRVDELINAGGLKTSPEIIEDTIISFDGIAECAVFGVPDNLGVEQIWAAVAVGPQVNLEELRKHCAAKLGVRAPRRFLKLAQLPRNENGKVLRSELARLARTQ